MLFRRKPAVIVLDDYASIRKLLTLGLRRAGFRVTSVASGQEVLDAMKEQEFEALLLDIMMPHHGAFTVINHLRVNHPTFLKRVIVVTAAPTVVNAATRAELFAVVPKPFNMGELAESVKACIEQSRTAAALTRA